jgi:signal transduction histidine kinase
VLATFDSDVITDASAGASVAEGPGRRTRLLELLAVIAADLLEATDVPAAVDRLFATIRAELRLDVFFHYRFDERTGLSLEAYSGFADDEIAVAMQIQLGEGVCGSVARDKSPLVIHHLQQSTDVPTQFLRRNGVLAFACAPLIHRGELLGTLGFGRRGLHVFDEAEIHFLQTICSYVTLARHRISTEQALRAGLAERDRLIAEQVDMEQRVIELTRTSALGAVASTVAHELNQPLAAAANFMSALRLAPDPSPEKVQELTRASEAQLLRAGEIIRRIRRMVAREEAALEPDGLRAIIEEAISLVKAASGGRLPHFAIHTGPDADVAMVDHIQIVQVLANLLRNAVESTRDVPAGQVRVETARLSRTEVEVRVVDNGEGVTEDVRHAMFEPRIGRSRGGLGLGLAISHNLIEAHGGRIRIEDTPGGGATFCFTVPAIG